MKQLLANAVCHFPNLYRLYNLYDILNILLREPISWTMKPKSLQIVKSTSSEQSCVTQIRVQIRYWVWKEHLWNVVVNLSPEKYRVEISVETSFYQQDHHVPHFWIFFFFYSLEHLIGASWSRVVPHYSFMVSHERRTSCTTLVLHNSGHCEVVLDGLPVLLRGTASGEPSHGTCSCWKQMLLYTWSPAPSTSQLIQLGTLLTMVMVFNQLLTCSGVLGPFISP